MIDSNILTYQPYIDTRATADKEFTSGFSGELLLAEAMDGKRYLVKHTFPHNAANEYVACWLAEKMNILCPKAYLLSHNKRFNSEYAVAIEYIDGFETFDVGSLSDTQKTDVISHYKMMPGGCGHNPGPRLTGGVRCIPMNNGSRRSSC